MGPVTKTIHLGVGTLAEVIASGKSASEANKSVKEAHAERERAIAEGRPIEDSGYHSEDDDDDDSEYSDDEGDWQVAEEAEKNEGKPVQKSGGAATIESLVDNVVSLSGPPPYQKVELRAPVIIPQRRPGASGRGFIRAYAPDLQEAGINQKAFITFLDSFDSAAMSTPVLKVIYLGIGLVGMVPHWYAQIGSMALQAACYVAMERQKRSRGNDFLDQMNEKFFKPRGLFCMIMGYKPDQQRPISSEQVDINKVIAGELPKSAHPTARKVFGPALSKGETYGELELPESCPLIFPGVDKESQERIKADGKKKKRQVLHDYNDAKAQHKWIEQNPESALNLPEDQKPKFASKLADPNHPAFQGSWPTLVSWGKIPPMGQRTAAWKAHRERKKNAAAGSPTDGPPAEGSAAAALEAKKTKKKRKAIKNVMYLTVIPLPTDEQLEAAHMEMQRHEAAMNEEMMNRGTQ